MELWGTAVHEAGHTVAAWYLNPAFAVEKVGSVPAVLLDWCAFNIVTQAGG
jgi:ATP-dependent Zn protease